MKKQVFLENSLPEDAPEMAKQALAEVLHGKKGKKEEDDKYPFEMENNK